MGKTSIEWTRGDDGSEGETWNPTTGCTKVSPGCANCYIERTPPFRMAGRKFVGGKIPLELHADRLDKPLHWRKPRRVFVNSLSDLFHDDVPDDFIDRVFAVMNATAFTLPAGTSSRRWHTYQVLTKRAERMAEYAESRRTVHWNNGNHPIFDAGRGEGGPLRGRGPDVMNAGAVLQWPLPNVWLGVSVEDQQRADERIPHLLRTPAAVRFLSCEPLLGPVDLSRWLNIRWQCSGCRGLFDGAYQKICPECGKSEYWSGSHPFNGRHRQFDQTFPPQSGSGIDWTIIGGESGPGSRPFAVEWARSIIRQCQSAGVPVFLKQLGSNPYGFDAKYGTKGICGDMPVSAIHQFDRKGGDMAEWPDDIRVRQFPEAATA